jgi:hypothetical protein
MRELPTDAPMDLIEHFVRIDRLLEEARYTLDEKKFEEAKEKAAQEKAILEVQSGKQRAKGRAGKRTA